MMRCGERRAEEILNTLLRALKCPEMAKDFSLPLRNVLMPVARKSQLLARLACLMSLGGLLEAVSPRVQRHLEAAVRVAEAHHRALLWEADRLRWALQGLHIPIILLKGAAYGAENLDASLGRLSSDVDILVPKEVLPAVEQALLSKGWEPVKDLPYDQRYYRAWMHELPPLRHKDRGSVVDVHHNLLPPMGRMPLNVHDLWRRVRPSKLRGFWVLSPEDMLIHNAVHVFQDGVVWGGLRDVVDAHSLMEEFSRDGDFWPRFVHRAAALGTVRPCFYACWAAQSLMGAPVPPWVMERFSRMGLAVSFSRRMLMWSCTRALRGGALSKTGLETQVARGFLFVRSHWLRMPPMLLARHAVQKLLKL
ncbi:MAG: nucleotidyltransferase domain-containing protein [Desulfosoma sp.]|uniref:nucleotidyltransferase domain-containing protein n=1 Tax=Desulfosoma sp. TaxID=2603217 RepID=UPI00404AE592